MDPDVLIHTPDKHMLQDATKKLRLSLWLAFGQRFLAHRHLFTLWLLLEAVYTSCYYTCMF